MKRSGATHWISTLCSGPGEGRWTVAQLRLLHPGLALFLLLNENVKAETGLRTGPIPPSGQEGGARRWPGGVAELQPGRQRPWHSAEGEELGTLWGAGGKVPADPMVAELGHLTTPGAMAGLCRLGMGLILKQGFEHKVVIIISGY